MATGSVSVMSFRILHTVIGLTSKEVKYHQLSTAEVIVVRSDSCNSLCWQTYTQSPKGIVVFLGQLGNITCLVTYFHTDLFNRTSDEMREFEYVIYQLRCPQYQYQFIVHFSLVFCLICISLLYMTILN